MFVVRLCFTNTRETKHDSSLRYTLAEKSVNTTNQKESSFKTKKKKKDSVSVHLNDEHFVFNVIYRAPYARSAD